MMTFIISIIVLMVTFYYLMPRSIKIKPTKEHAVFITGCDSGIGYSLACHCVKLGLTVFAGCLNLHSAGALQLQELPNVHLLELDVCNNISIKEVWTKINKILNENNSLKLKTLVNNAGVMVFGEFSWLSPNIIEQQIGVNLIGAMKVTSTFMSLLVKNKGRIVNICSHCSLEALPGLSVYAASKSGLLAWSNALRIEMKKFHVNVISLIPGSFPMETNILSKQREFAEEMKQHMSADDWTLYEDYFLEYNTYLCNLGSLKLREISNKYFYTIFEDAILNITPKSQYINSPPRYKFYHTLFKITPTFIHDYLVIRFMNMPKWKR